MSAITLILLPAAVVAAVAAGAAAHHVRGLRREIAGLREELLAGTVAVPAARHTPALEEVRAVVADALAEERERELAEARAFWAAQEAREAGDEAPLAVAGLEAAGLEYDGGGVDAALLDALLDDTDDFGFDASGPVPGGYAGGYPEDAYDAGTPDGTGVSYDVIRPFLPRQAGPEDVDTHEPAAPAAGPDSAELAAARRRHPSDPHFSLSGEPVVPAPAQAPEKAYRSDHDHTIERLGALAAQGVALADVRSGPLGTLDVYVFADQTTVCLTPGHRETADRLGRALDEGLAPVLLGGSGISGAYALTFGCGEETVYVLADRVIASR